MNFHAKNDNFSVTNAISFIWILTPKIINIATLDYNDDFWRENSNLLHIVKWDFLSDFQTLCNLTVQIFKDGKTKRIHRVLIFKANSWVIVKYHQFSGLYDTIWTQRCLQKLWHFCRSASICFSLRHLKNAPHIFLSQNSTVIFSID